MAFSKLPSDSSRGDKSQPRFSVEREGRSIISSAPYGVHPSTMRDANKQVSRRRRQFRRTIERRPAAASSRLAWPAFLGEPALFGPRLTTRALGLRPHPREFCEEVCLVSRQIRFRCCHSCLSLLWSMMTMLLMCLT